MKISRTSKRFKIALPLLLMSFVHTGCVAIHDSPGGNAPDSTRRIFLGVWEGEHLDREGNLLRKWIQNRLEDGTYTILFFHYTDRGIHKSTQKGKWWIDGDRFYEIAPDVMDEPDVYHFEILGENEIRFKSVTKDYEFIDRRMQDFPDATLL